MSNDVAGFLSGAFMAVVYGVNKLPSIVENPSRFLLGLALILITAIITGIGMAAIFETTKKVIGKWTGHISKKKSLKEY
jgi:hypothetical protein